MPQTEAALYEGLFLINQQEMAGDLDGAIAHVREILERAEAEVVVLRKWDERKLAYPIDGQKRGLYILALFRAPAVQIANIDRDCNLSDLVMRVMMTRADHYGDVEIADQSKEGETSEAEAALRREPPAAEADADAKVPAETADA